MLAMLLAFAANADLQDVVAATKTGSSAGVYVLPQACRGFGAPACCYCCPTRMAVQRWTLHQYQKRAWRLG